MFLVVSVDCGALMARNKTGRVLLKKVNITFCAYPEVVVYWECIPNYIHFQDVLFLRNKMDFVVTANWSQPYCGCNKICGHKQFFVGCNYEIMYLEMYFIIYICYTQLIIFWWWKICWIYYYDIDMIMLPVYSDRWQIIRLR